MRLKTLGRTKRGNANAQRNNNRKKGMELSEELVKVMPRQDVPGNNKRKSD